MCVLVVIEGAPERSASNKATLREILGVEPVKLPGYSVWMEHDCLCPCDVPATLANAGISDFERDELGAYYCRCGDGQK